MQLVDTLIAWIGLAQRIFVAIVGPILDFVDARQVIRRAMVLIVLWQLVDAYVFAKQYAMRPGMSGAELAAVIAAILVPVTALQGVLFRMYDTVRRHDEPVA